MDELSIIELFLGGQGRLTAFPAKNKKKLEALWYLAQKFQPDRVYTEAGGGRFSSTGSVG